MVYIFPCDSLKQMTCLLHILHKTPFSKYNEVGERENDQLSYVFSGVIGSYSLKKDKGVIYTIGPLCLQPGLCH